MLCEETDGLTRSGFIEVSASGKEKGNGLWLRFAFKGRKSSGKHDCERHLSELLPGNG